MTPHLAASLTIHEPDVVEIASTAERLFAAPKLVQSPASLREGQELDEARLPAIWRRESLHRRLLGLFDVAGAAVALTIVLGVSAADRAVATATFGALLLVVLFKLAGLYDRDEMRIVHSTLDELPLLLQLTGLFALLVTIADSVVAGATLADWQMAALWVGSCAAVVAGRFAARSLAGRIAPAERCMVIGDPEHARVSARACSPAPHAPRSSPRCRSRARTTRRSDRRRTCVRSSPSCGCTGSSSRPPRSTRARSPS